MLRDGVLFGWRQRCGFERHLPPGAQGSTPISFFLVCEGFQTITNKEKTVANTGQQGKDGKNADEGETIAKSVTRGFVANVMKIQKLGRWKRMEQTCDEDLYEWK